MSGPLVSSVNRVDDTQCHDEDLENVVHKIGKGTWQGIVDEYRTACRAGKTEKNWLPAFTPSGRFKKRNAEGLAAHSELIIADLDKLGAELETVRKQLESSPHVYCVFVSIGGNGLKAFFYVAMDSPAQHPDAFRAVHKHVFELTGKRIDKSGKDVCRLCVVSSDPKIYVNRLPLPMEPLPPEPARAKPAERNGSKPSKAEIREMLAVIPKRPDYPDWITIVSAVGDALPDGDAIEVLNEWSLEERSGEYAEKLRHRLQDVHVGTLIHLAQKHGWENKKSARTVQLSTVAMMPIVFIDKPLFQANAFHLLVGKKNAGKGTFLSSVAARFTRGELGEKRNVLWIAAGEDSLGLDVHPRIVAAGGDAARVFCPEASYTTRLPADIPLIRQWIEQIGNVGLVVIDPVSGTLRVGSNSNQDTDVRAAISPLNELAGSMESLIIGVRHLGKGASERGALESVLGSVDWVNVPRAVLAIAIDADDETIRHVQVKAGNRLPRGSASRSFRIVGVNVVEGGESVAKAEFIEGDGKDVDECLRAEGNGAPLTKTMLARKAILNKLEIAPEGLKSKALSEEIAAETGISASTIEEAKTWLKNKGLIRFNPERDEAGKVKSWQVLRTDVKRPPELEESHFVTQYGGACSEEPLPTLLPDTNMVGSSYCVDRKWMQATQPLRSHILPHPTTSDTGSRAS
jgi:VirE N-terminal domain/AAA domain